MQPGKPLPGIRSLMAVINSVGVGRGSKSVGEFTYRYTRGRTIASRRITKNTSKTPAQVGRRGAFGSFVWMFSPYKWFFSDGYEKTKHGSSFNQFVHVNRELLGKSPYNSEVNKKLIPNGTQLWKLVGAITQASVPHLKYATYGTLNFAEQPDYSETMAHRFRGTVYTEDFKGFSITVNAVDNKGNTYTKEIPLYENSEVPTLDINYPWQSSEKMEVVSSNEAGTLFVNLEGHTLSAYVLGLSQKPPTTISLYMSVILKQYGKIASTSLFIHSSVNSASEDTLEDKEKNSEPVQEDNTEIK